jgi:predicted metal-dependent hydrolase
MNSESLKQKLIAELNENSILLYAERQKFKQDNLPLELLQKMRSKYVSKKSSV